jgi:hypothetical protein
VGDDLIGYAKLCALGKQWQPVYTAATAYINSKDEAKPQLGMAYAFEIQADLNLDHEKDAVGAMIAMLRSMPYGPLVDEVSTATVRYLEFAYTRDAISVMVVRQPMLLNMLSEPAPTVPVHLLLEHALELPAIEQFDDEPGVAGIWKGDVDRAMPKQVSPDEAILIANVQRRYGMLGKHFPVLPGAVYLLSATETPHRQPEFGPATVFFLFPPWCVQCVRQAQQMVPAMVRTAVLKGPDYKAPSMYALLADSTPPVLPGRPPVAKSGVHPKVAEQPEPPKPVSEQLRKTPTLVVTPSVLADFDATDFPFLIATDRDGIIRLMFPAAPENALVQGGIVDQLTSTIIARWPGKEAK